ncbi:cysteine proteinase [Cubamyces sp. BRFM 1775]|nr:cysteine proteinase [Cubamyces sp. BRFM 1775]
MRAAGLHAIATLLQTEAVLIKSSTPKHPALEPLIKLITSRIAGVVAAGKYVVCEYNILRERVHAATAITPGRRAPTISPLEDDAWVAVSSMVEKSKVADVMDELVKIGAEDILIFNLDNCRSQYSKAANAELAKEYDRAFRHYVKAAEHFLLLSRQATDDRPRTLYRNQAAKALERAEKIKAIKQDIRPALYVLQKSSLVNQGFFPLWDSSDRPSPPSEQPPLSAEQQKYGATWRRPEDDECSVHSDPFSQLAPHDVAQHIVSDCSVCGAVAVCIDHHRRFGSKLVIDSLYPQDARGVPCKSNTGQYEFRILYNGGHRRVSFDDQLPTHPDGTWMCMSAGEKGQLWPSLVEKAYMKLAGGYDFIGSALAGWIPEHVDMKRCFIIGDCVLTLGTGQRVPSSSLLISLLPVHCYAVIGVSEEDHRRLTIFDPWVQPADNNSGDKGNANRTFLCAGVIEISWEEVCNLFDGIYLSWRPQIFEHQLSFHGYAVTAHFRGQLQLEATDGSQDEQPVWLHLTRHIRSHRSSPEYISLSAQNGTGIGTTSNRDNPSTKASAYDGVCGQQCNLIAVQVRTSITANESITLAASYEGERDDVGFTLTAYSNARLTWVHTPAEAPYAKNVEGAFTHKSAGGNHTYPTYYLNPQYFLRIQPRTTHRDTRDTKADLSISLSGDRQIPMNVTLAWSQGERINELGHNDLALSSGPYSYGYALASSRVPPGDYTLVVSAFEPRHIGKFDLRVESSEKFEITPILREGAGMFSQTLKGQWTRESAAGGPSFGNYSSNPTYELHVPSASQLKFRLQLTKPSPTASLNLTIFNATAASTSGTHLATSGPYSDAISGVVIQQTTFQPGRYLLIPSTYHPGIITDFLLIVYSTVSGVRILPTTRS